MFNTVHNPVWLLATAVHSTDHYTELPFFELMHTVRQLDCVVVYNLPGMLLAMAWFETNVSKILYVSAILVSNFLILCLCTAYNSGIILTKIVTQIIPGANLQME